MLTADKEKKLRADLANNEIGMLLFGEIDRLRAEDFTVSAYEWQQQALNARRERDQLQEKLAVAVRALKRYDNDDELNANIAHEALVQIEGTTL